MAEPTMGIRWRFPDCHIVAVAALLMLFADGLGGPAIDQSTWAQESVSEGPWLTCSSTSGTCTDVMVRAILLARTTIVVESSDLGPRSVVHALCSAMWQGVDVRVVQDPSVCSVAKSGAGQESLDAQCDPNYRVDRPQTTVIDANVVITSFFSSPMSSTAPRPVPHLSLIKNGLSALAYLDAWQGRSRRLGPALCGDGGSASR
jgi:hypothetical protein